MNENNPLILVLAAGEAARMGRAKQLLVYQGKNLLQHAIERAMATGFEVLVVLGAHVEKTKPIADGYEVTTMVNAQWSDGIGSSIRRAIDHAEKNFDISGILITLADQPTITTAHLAQLIRIGLDKQKPAATTYRGVTGVPAYFPRNYLKYLKVLEGDQGAQSVLKGCSKQTISLNFPTASIDIDTEQDWKNFLDGSIEI